MTAGKVESILQFLVEGDQMIRFGASKDIILVMGKTGTGKTTLTHFLASHDNSMKSVEKGAGNYIIQDTSKKICARTTESCTVIPELVIDQNTTSLYYDWPGFDDTRSVANDIGVTYFVKKVIRRSEKIKILFTISYDSVREGGSRQPFMDLAYYVFSMVKNIEKLSNSICLVVTKVDNIRKRVNQKVSEEFEDDQSETLEEEKSTEKKPTEKKYELVEDGDIIAGIASFIKTVQKCLQDKIANGTATEDINFHKNTVTFINAIINGTKPKIGIMRKPEESGKLKKMKLLQKGKKALQELIHNQLIYSLSNENDFGFSISDKSKLEVSKLQDEICVNIDQTIRRIGLELIDSISKWEKRSSNIDELKTHLLHVRDNLNILTLSENEPALGFAQKLAKVVEELEISTSEQRNVQHLFNYCGHLKFTESLKKQSAGQNPRWSNNLRDAINYVEDSNKWYNLLTDLRTTLSQYIIQQDFTKFMRIKNNIVADIANVNYDSAKKNLNELLSAVNEKVPGRKFEVPVIKQFDGVKLRFLGNLVERAFSNIDIKCHDSKVVVKGSFIKMSSVLSTPCYEQSHIVEVLALSKVFFDAEFRKTQGFLSLITPELEVIDKQQLILDGKRGPHYESRASQGMNGQPGKPGGSAGSLVGIGLKCINCNKMYLSVNGGKGGRGQNGGDGVEGYDGKTPPNVDCGYDSWRSALSVRGYYAREGSSANKKYIVEGKEGTSGGRGGDGGRGGLPGLTGNAWWIFNMTNQGGPTNKPVGPTGEGEGGLGGPGGVGGAHGWNLFYTSGCEATYEDILMPLKMGISGSDNKNALGRIPPNPIKFNPTFSVNQYKSFLRQNLANPISVQVLKNFLEYIETTDSVNELYNTKDLVEDLFLMESQLDVDLEPINIRSYRNFLHRIVKHAQSQKLNNTAELKLTCGYLYAVILSKISNIKENANTRMVIDIKEYLQLMREDIERLENLSVVLEKNKSKSKYQEIVNNKIIEAKNLIDREITPNINNSTRQLEIDMKSLVDETIALQQQARADEIKMLESRKKLEDQMVLQVGLGILQGVGQMMMFLDPISAMVGTGITLGTSVASGVLINDAPEDIKLSKLPQGVETFREDLMKHFKQKQELYKSQLQAARDMMTGVGSDSSVITDLKRKIDQIQIALAEAIENIANDGDTKSIEKSYQLQNDVELSIDESIEQLEEQKQNQGNDKTIDGCLTILSKMKIAITIANIGLDITKKAGDTQSAIENMNEAIKNKNHEIAKLKGYEKSIYMTMIPLSRGIKTTVVNAMNTSSGKSHTVLDVSSWQVQAAIRDIQKTLKAMTNGFDSQGDIVNTIDKVIYAMSTVIQVYDRIQDYYDQAQLADLISDITSHQAELIRVNDTHLKQAINKLKFEMQKNILLAEYKKSMSAVRQCVFPFGSLVDTYSLPSELRVANSSHTMANVVHNIVTVLRRLETDAAVIKSKDTNIFVQQSFNSLANETSPFYVWKYKTNQNLIQKLLQGNEVMLNADITRGIQENAVKFNQIGIYLKTISKQHQYSLNKNLDGFSIKLTHLGQSYYRCGRQIFMMTHGHIEMQHSMNKKNGEYFKLNQVYKKVYDNNPQLSPFGMWKMKLIGDDFNKLNIFAGLNIDIELEGRGSFINHDNDDTICTDDLNKYYQDVTNTFITADYETNLLENDDVDPNQNDNKSIGAKSATTKKGARRRKRATSKVVSSLMQYVKPSKNVSHSTVTSMNSTNISMPTFEAISHRGKSAETNNYSTINSVDYNSFDMQGSLLFLNMLFHKVNVTNPKRTNASHMDDDYAHKLAYGAYASP